VLFWAAIVWMLFVFAVAIFAGLLPIPDPPTMGHAWNGGAYSMQHWLGTDARATNRAADLRRADIP